MLVTADLHFTDNPRDSYRFDFLPWFEEQARKKRVSHVVIAGDITEEKDRHSAWLVNKITGQLKSLSEQCRVVILPGNHDYKTRENPFFEFLKHIPSITWISEPSDNPDIGAAADGMPRCLFLPHTANYERDWAKINFKGYYWIFAHNTFTGARGDNGRQLTGIPLSIFPKDAQVIAGDIHVPQTIGCLTYVGAPYRVDFGDDYEPRILHLQGGEFDSIPVPGQQKRLVEINSIADLKRRAKDIAKGDILKVRVNLNGDERDQWPEMQEQVKEWGREHGFVVHTVQPKMEAAGKSKAVDRSEARSDAELLEAYAESRGVDERTLNTGRWLMGKLQ